MTDDAGRDLLVRGIAAAKAKSVDEARFFLEKCLRQRPSIETRVQAWRYLAEIATTPSEKRDYLGRILAFDPTDGLARRALAVLDGRRHQEAPAFASSLRGSRAAAVRASCSPYARMMAETRRCRTTSCSSK